MKKILLILTLIISSSYLITCSSDDDDDPIVIKDKIIGEWQLTAEYLNDIPLPLDDCELQMTIEFFENETYAERDFEYDEDQNECQSLPI